MKKIVIAMTLFASSLSLGAEREYSFINKGVRAEMGAFYLFYQPEYTQAGEDFLLDLRRGNTNFDCVSDISLKLSKIKESGPDGAKKSPLCTVSINISKDDKIESFKFSEQVGFLTTSDLNRAVLVPTMVARMNFKDGCAVYNYELKDVYRLLNQNSLFCEKGKTRR